MDTVDEIINKVTTEGYAVVNRWNPRLSMEEVAAQLGIILDVSKLLPNSGIGKVQTLKPRKPSAINESVQWHLRS